ncbi:MAG: FMN-binding protein [Streptosporangiaceae bacterium]
MRRVVLALGGTVAGLVMLLSFRSHMASTASAGVTAGPGGTGTSPGSSGSAGSGGPAPVGAAAGRSAPVSAGSGTGSAVTGDAIATPYGPTQVQVTLNAGKIVKVTVLQHTDDGINSQMIDGHALPLLNQETLAAQNAKIDAVSGASYTSAGYIRSLQSALDKASA